MPSGKIICFVDTNVLLYGRDRKNPDKRAAAADWIRRLSAGRQLVISPQVMNEYSSVVLRKRVMADLSELEMDLEGMKEWCTAETTADTASMGLRLHRSYGFSFYDSVLLASALTASCNVFLSEDMNGGQRIDGLLLVNPFRHKPVDLEKLVT
jgi:predicted nucleic acid-binding protein